MWMTSTQNFVFVFTLVQYIVNTSCNFIAQRSKNFPLGSRRHPWFTFFLWFGLIRTSEHFSQHFHQNVPIYHFFYLSHNCQHLFHPHVLKHLAPRFKFSQQTNRIPFLFILVYRKQLFIRSRKPHRSSYFETRTR